MPKFSPARIIFRKLYDVIEFLEKSMSFLIVDDNQAMRRAIKRVVREFTDEIVECDDGAFAFAAYRKHLPEWVLMDVEMKEKDGLTATREICAAYPKAHVVIVTKHDDILVREAAAKAGAIGYVVKEDLLELRGILSLQKAENQKFRTEIK